MAVKPHTVKVSHLFNASPEEVFDAWLEPDLLAQWMFDPAICDQTVEEIRLDPRPGGQFLFRIKRDNRQIEYSGAYIHVERPTRLVFTWLNAGGGHETLVTIDFEAIQTGCRLSLVHVLGDVTDKIAELAKADWEAELASLDRNRSFAVSAARGSER